MEPKRGGGSQAAAAAAFGALAFLRGRHRVFHPVGAAYRATFTPDRHAAGDWALVSRSRPVRAVVRVSRGAGLPEPLPDHAGLGIRLLDAYGAGHHQDLMLGSSLGPPGGRHLLLPAAGRLTPLSSVLPYRLGGRLVLIGGRPLDGPAERMASGETSPPGAEGARWELRVAPLLGTWRPLGVLRLGRRLAQQEADALRLNPWNTGGGLEPAGLLNRLRQGAYRGSQLVRGDAS